MFCSLIFSITTYPAVSFYAVDLKIFSNILVASLNGHGLKTARWCGKCGMYTLWASYLEDGCTDKL